jgi:hypothetical protein
MGNISFIVPTIRKENFNIDKVSELLKENFPNLTFDVDLKFNQIRVRNDNGLVTDIFFNQECHVLNFDRDIKELIDAGKTELAEKLKKLKSMNPDLNNCIQTTYGSGKAIQTKFDIDYFLKDYFQAYVFDEGIHPEFITPDYKQPKTSKIKKFFNFLENM